MLNVSIRLNPRGFINGGRTLMSAPAAKALPCPVTTATCPALGGGTDVEPITSLAARPVDLVRTPRRITGNFDAGVSKTLWYLSRTCQTFTSWPSDINSHQGWWSSSATPIYIPPNCLWNLWNKYLENYVFLISKLFSGASDFGDHSTGVKVTKTGIHLCENIVRVKMLWK